MNMRLFFYIFIVILPIVITISHDSTEEDIINVCKKPYSIPKSKQLGQLNKNELLNIVQELKSKYFGFKVELERKNVELGQKDVELERKNVELGQKDVELERKNVELGQKDVELERKNIDLKQKDVDLRQKDVDLRQKDVDLTQKDAELKRNYDREVKINGTVKTVMEENIFYQTILGMRKFIEELEDILYPKYFLKTKKRCEKWLIILYMVDHPIADRIRKAIQESCFYKNYENFAIAVSRLYSDESEVLHLNIDFPRVSVDELIASFNHFKANLLTFKELEPTILFLMNITLPRILRSMKNDSKEDFIVGAECILLRGVPLSEENGRKIPIPLIKGFFRQNQAKTAINRICETAKSFKISDCRADVVVKFARPMNAANGFIDNTGIINKNDIGVNLVNCADPKAECQPEIAFTYIPEPIIPSFKTIPGSGKTVALEKNSLRETPLESSNNVNGESMIPEKITPLPETAPESSDNVNGKGNNKE